jgi:hypothetical protein
MDDIYLIINDKEHLIITDSLEPWKQFIKSGQKLESIKLCFRSHQVPMDIGQGCYIARGGYGFPGTGDSGRAVFFGTRDKDTLTKRLYKVPDIEIVDIIEDNVKKYLEMETYYGVSV